MGAMGRIVEWVTWRYPAEGDLDDNPLYLALSGERYCRRGRFGSGSKDWFRRCSAPGGAMLVRAIVFGGGAARSALRLCREAREGRLSGLYLSLSPREIVDAVIASSSESRARRSLACAFVLAGVALVLLGYKAASGAKGDVDAIGAACGALCAIPLGLGRALTLSSIMSFQRGSLVAVMDLPGDGSTGTFDPSTERMDFLVNNLVWPVVVWLSAFAVLLVLANWLSPTYCLIPAALGASFVGDRTSWIVYHGRVIRERRLAIESLRIHLLGILESNPVTVGR